MSGSFIPPNFPAVNPPLPSSPPRFPEVTPPASYVNAGGTGGSGASGGIPTGPTGSLQTNAGGGAFGALTLGSGFVSSGGTLSVSAPSAAGVNQQIQYNNGGNLAGLVTGPGVVVNGGTISAYAIPAGAQGTLQINNGSGGLGAVSLGTNLSISGGVLNATTGTATAGGLNGQLQVNSGGSLGGLTVGSGLVVQGTTLVAPPPGTNGQLAYNSNSQWAPLTLGTNLSIASGVLNAASGSASPGGPSASIQYNNGGAFGGYVLGSGLVVNTGTISTNGIPTSQIGVANGVAPLDSNAFVPAANLNLIATSSLPSATLTSSLLFVLEDSTGTAYKTTLGAMATFLAQPGLSVQTPNPSYNTTYTVNGSYINYTPTALDYSTNGGSTWTAASSPTIGSGNYSFTAAALGAGTYTLMVRDHTTTTIVATSNQFTVTATETITVNNPGSQVANTPFTLSGNWTTTQPTALDYNIGAGYVAASSPTINSNGTWNFSLTITSANPTQTVSVRDHNNTSVFGTSGSFVVSSSGNGPSLTMASPVWDTTTPRLGSAALSSGSGTASSLTWATGDFTVECWVKSTGTVSNSFLYWTDGTNFDYLGLQASGTTLTAGIGGASWNYGSTSIADGGWHHVAVVGSSSAGTVELYVDGVGGNTISFTNHIANPTHFYVDTNGAEFELDEVRISKVARWTTNFTPSSTPYSWDSNCVGLWHLDSSGASA